ncbi:MAG: efflux RND transporter periplasmic adaptor subunit, partial [Spirochaetota bacterium]|nr:efflux RND transporter periplasmic adaptor subunit [Spirochaetota bacterium]
MIKKNKLLILFICLIIGYFISGCKKNETKKLIEEKRINIQIQTAMTTILTPFLSSNGTLKSYDSVSVSSEAIGILEKVYVTEGSIVSKQMLLAEINSSDYFLEYERAKLTLQQLKARLDNAKISYDRERELIKFDATTREKLDLVKTEYITSKVEVEKAKVLISSARLNLNRTKIYSPLSGIVNLKKISAGDYVRTGMELFVIISNNPIKLHFSIPE